MRPLTALLVKRQAFYSSRDPFADLPSANPNACICKLSHSASVFVPSALLRYCVTIATASQNFLSDSFFLIFCFLCFRYCSFFLIFVFLYSRYFPFFLNLFFSKLYWNCSQYFCGHTKHTKINDFFQFKKTS